MVGDLIELHNSSSPFLLLLLLLLLGSPPFFGGKWEKEEKEEKERMAIVRRQRTVSSAVVSFRRTTKVLFFHSRCFEYKLNEMGSRGRLLPQVISRGLHDIVGLKVDVRACMFVVVWLSRVIVQSTEGAYMDTDYERG